MQCEVCHEETTYTMLESSTLLCSNCYHTPPHEGGRQVHFDDVSGSATPIHDRTKIASDGLSTAYYGIPDHARELRHLISHKGMSKSRGDIFKACYRLGEKEGTDTAYDLNKMKFFIEDLIEMHERGELL